MTSFASSPSTHISTDIIRSLRNLVKRDDNSIDWNKLEQFIRDKAENSYKNWQQTSLWADQLESIIGSPTDQMFQDIFERVLIDGNWYGALEKSKSEHHNWIVLVTGLNGIRKTTSIYQPWFKSVLQEALGDALSDDAALIDSLPIGQNSFFRQLDFMIATLANENFRTLYSKTNSLSTSEYSSQKDIIFKNYRTIAEILGILLLRSAQKTSINALVETSGRDIAMFDYVDHLYSDKEFKKLVLHFSINDIRFAEQSVDTRMDAEMKKGMIASIANEGMVDYRAIVQVNAGGPYGSQVLRGVQADSDKVWDQVVKDETRNDWLKASILINGNDNPAEWSVQAILPNGKISPNKYYFLKDI